MSWIGQAKGAVRALAYHSGILGAIHARRNRSALTTLMFHRVLPADSSDYASAEREFTFSTEGFGRCLDFVRKHYHCVSLQQVRTAQQGGAALPANPVLITFDDGWRDTLVHAQQALQQRGLTGVLFVATEPLESKEALWWQYVLVHVLADAEATARLYQAMGVEQPLPGEPTAGQRLTARLAELADVERHRLLELAAPKSLGGETGQQMLSRADLERLDPRCIELGAHGHTHAPLLYAADPEDELRRSHALLVARGDVPVTMSFPHGSYDERLLSISHQVGFQLVFTSDPELSRLDRLRQSVKLGRIHVPENQWTCSGGRISFSRLATFLFFRPHA